MLHYILTVHAADVERQNRVIETVSFVIGCGWLTLLFLSEGFRAMYKWLPGGIWTACAGAIAIIVMSAVLLK